MAERISQVETQKSEGHLLRALGPFDATTIVVGSMIGSGIFIAPSLMAGYIESPGILLLIWVAAGLFTIMGGLCYGELSAMMPKAGGQYVFLREAFGPLLGFLYGWTVFLVIQTGFIAAVAVAFAKYLGVFIPGVSEHALLFHHTLVLAGKTVNLSLNTAQVVGIASIIVLTLINVFGVRAGALVQNLFTTLKVGAVLLLIGASFALFKGGWSHFQPLFSLTLAEGAAKLSLAGALAVCASKALFAYDAWNTVTFTGEEVKDPHKNLPLSLLWGTALVTVIYTTVCAAYYYVIPTAQAFHVQDNRIAAEVAKILVPSVGASLIAVGILISTFGCNNGLILGGPRVYYAMARDGLFFKGVSKLHPKYLTPVVALVFQMIWSSVLVLSGSYNDLLTYTTFGSIVFGALAVIGLFVLRRRMPDAPRPYKVPGYPVIPALYVLLALLFALYVLTDGDPRNSGLGLAIILTGIPAYFFWKRPSGQPPLAPVKVVEPESSADD